MRKSLTALVAMVFLSVLTLINANNIYAKVFATVEGTVKSEDGKPVEGARVILIFSEDGTKYELSTDKNGKWRKANIRPGSWTIGFLA